MKNGVRAFATSLACAGLVLTGAISATAATEDSSLDPELVTEVTNVWSAHGVSSDDQELLLEKMSDGIPLDSMKGGEPTSVEDAASDGRITQVQRFADGSINVLNVELPSPSAEEPGVISTRGVSECTQSGFRYNNCLIDGWFTAVQLGFRATYVLGSTAAQIIEYHTPAVQCFPGVECGSPWFSLVRQKQSGNDAAQVSMGANWNYIVVGGGSTTYLHLYVRDQSAWTN